MVATGFCFIVLGAFNYHGDVDFGCRVVGRSFQLKTIATHIFITDGGWMFTVGNIQRDLGDIRVYVFAWIVVWTFKLSIRNDLARDLRHQAPWLNQIGRNFRNGVRVGARSWDNGACD